LVIYMKPMKHFANIPMSISLDTIHFHWDLTRWIGHFPIKRKEIFKGGWRTEWIWAYDK
jgi:hypothetical protein